MTKRKKEMKKILKYGLIVALTTAMASCASWLDVKPTDRTSGDVLFTSREGFAKALNGVYVELNDRNIYGRNMSTLLDLMGQYYYKTSSSGVYDAIGRYNYDDANYAKPTFQAMWEKTYFLIVNLNVIIDECGESNDILPGIWHGLIKGEALAMRAFLHFDMLRLFGPVYAHNPKATAIPYVTNTDQTVSPLLTAEQAGQRIIDDLTGAIAMLKDTDPIIENGRMNSAGADGNNSLRYRQYRMNYYAARALLARVYMWVGDNRNAYITSTELLRDAQLAGGEVFPFITGADAMDGTIPDRMFSTEAMFAAYDNYITVQIFNYAFLPTLVDNQILKFSHPTNGELWSGRISQLYSNIDDYRYKLWFATYFGIGSGSVHFFRKFETPGGNASLSNTQRNKLATFRYMHPLIRITEVYLIAAESCLNYKGDLTEAKSYLNKIRAARNVADLPGDNDAQLRDNIEWEFRREFLGEGQMFFYYKRIAKQLIPNGSNSGTGTVEMTDVKYVVPLPDSEMNERESD